MNVTLLCRHACTVHLRVFGGVHVAPEAVGPKNDVGDREALRQHCGRHGRCD